MNFDFSQVAGNTAVDVTKEVVKEKKKVARTVAEVKPAVSKKNNVTKIEEAKTKSHNEVTTVNSTDVVKLSQAMANIKQDLNNRFIERTAEIDVLSVAFVSGTNVFLHGRPGTGKSDLVEEFSKRFVGSEYFRMLMSKTTEPSEVFGPVSINELKNDSYKVITDNKLPKANIAFLDEVGKANSAILNGLLTIMNEKLFFNDVVEEVPLVSIIGASNEFFEEESLAALYDRFLLRCNVEAIKDANNRVKLFESFINRRNNSVNAQSSTNANVPTMSYSELGIMIDLAKGVTFSKYVINEYNRLFASLEKEGIIVSDRRKNEAIKVIQATAIINGRLQADIEDFEFLTYCFWEDIDDISIVKKIISKLSNPDADFINGYMESLKEMKDEMKTFIDEHKDDDDYEMTKAVKITELRSKVGFAIEKIDEKVDTTTNPSNKQKFEAVSKELKLFLKYITDILVGEIK